MFALARWHTRLVLFMHSGAIVHPASQIGTSLHLCAILLAGHKPKGILLYNSRQYRRALAKTNRLDPYLLATQGSD